MESSIAEFLARWLASENPVIVRGDPSHKSPVCLGGKWLRAMLATPPLGAGLARVRTAVRAAQTHAPPVCGSGVCKRSSGRVTSLGPRRRSCRGHVPLQTLHRLGDRRHSRSTWHRSPPGKARAVARVTQCGSGCPASRARQRAPCPPALGFSLAPSCAPALALRSLQCLAMFDALSRIGTGAYLFGDCFPRPPPPDRSWVCLGGRKWGGRPLPAQRWSPALRLELHPAPSLVAAHRRGSDAIRRIASRPRPKSGPELRSVDQLRALSAQFRARIGRTMDDPHSRHPTEISLD